MRTISDLRRYFRSLDIVFFSEQCTAEGVRIRWKKYRDLNNHFYFGQYHPERKEIWINQRLARLDVPDYVVMATVLHEMLHHIVGLEHDVPFLQAEQRYPHHWVAMKWEAEFLENMT